VVLKTRGARSFLHPKGSGVAGVVDPAHKNTAMANLWEVRAIIPSTR